MTTPNLATSNKTASDEVRTRQFQAGADDVRSPPMTHQNSGSHGYEMRPQQFVRLVGCHDASISALRSRQSEKLH